MKILHTADWHIGQFKGPVEDGVNLRSLDTVKCLEFMVETAKEVRPDLVCVSGDVFHQEQIGPVRYSDEMVTATRIIEDLSECAKFVVVMRGTPNHDGAGQFRVLTKMLEKNKKVAVITTPQVISTPIADIACIPGFDKQEFRSKFPGLSAEEENLTWTKYISDMVMGLRAQCSNTNILPDMTPKILMAHYTVPGCNMESGQTSFFSNFEPVIPREALQTAGYSAVLLGHIHRPQILEGLDNVFYSGAINAMNFNDEGQSRGFWIHEFERGQLKSGHRYETPFREFQTVTWTQEDVESYLREGKIFLMNEKYPELVSDKIVRIKYSCTSEQKKALNIPVLQSDLYDMGAFYVADIEAESMVEIANRGYISVCDPACGAGATLIATVSEMKLSKYNFQNHVVFVGQDVDRVAGMMCYIQLSLLGCAGYICIGDTLTNPVTGHVLFPQEREGQELWIMPMFRIGPWAHRRLFFLLGKAGWNEYREAERGRERFYMFFDFNDKEEKRWEKM